MPGRLTSSEPSAEEEGGDTEGPGAALRVRGADGRLLQLFAVALLIEFADELPETQVDWALADLAELMRGGYGVEAWGRSGVATLPVFFRYDDLMGVPVYEVRRALSAAEAGGSLQAAVRRLPFLARPAAAHRAPAYLRFVVGLRVIDGQIDARARTDRLACVEELVRAVLAVRLGTRMTVRATCGDDYCGCVAAALRGYQRVRLERVVDDLGGGPGLAASLEVHDRGEGPRGRLVLMRDGKAIAAFVMHAPRDESSSAFRRRVMARLAVGRVRDAATGDAIEQAESESLGILPAVPL